MSRSGTSGRPSTSTSGNSTKNEQAKLKKILEELIKKEDNRFCADCGARGPRWASTKFGVFICIGCSGIHRSLGTHLTFVRSVNLDTWTSDQVEAMRKLGNKKASEFYEANIPKDFTRPNEHSSVREKEHWIRSKYEHRKFIAREAPLGRERSRSKPTKKVEDSSDEEEEQGRNCEKQSNGGRSRNHSSSQENSNGTKKETGRRTSFEKPSTNSKSNPPIDMLGFDDPHSAAVLQNTSIPAPSPISEPGNGLFSPVQTNITTNPSQGTPAGAEWAVFESAPSAQQGLNSVHTSKMANIMASFGPVSYNNVSSPYGGGMSQQLSGMNPTGINPTVINHIQSGYGGGMPQQSHGMNPMPLGYGMGIPPQQPGINPGMINPNQSQGFPMIHPHQPSTNGMYPNSTVPNPNNSMYFQGQQNQPSMPFAQPRGNFYNHGQTPNPNFNSNRNTMTSSYGMNNLTTNQFQNGNEIMGNNHLLQPPRGMPPPIPNFNIQQQDIPNQQFHQPSNPSFNSFSASANNNPFM